jgi:Leucine-rich repeat (LRR) protein
VLHLYENRLQSVDLSILKKCRKLRNLTLTKNELETVDVSALYNCPNLQKMGLDSDTKATAEAKHEEGTVPPGLKSLQSRIEWY